MGIKIEQKCSPWYGELDWVVCNLEESESGRMGSMNQNIPLGSSLQSLYIKLIEVNQATYSMTRHDSVIKKELREFKHHVCPLYLLILHHHFIWFNEQASQGEVSQRFGNSQPFLRTTFLMSILNQWKVLQCKARFATVEVLALEYSTIHRTITYMEVIGALLSPNTRRGEAPTVCSDHITLETCSFNLISNTLHLNVLKQSTTVWGYR